MAFWVKRFPVNMGPQGSSGWISGELRLCCGANPLSLSCWIRSKAGAGERIFQNGSMKKSVQSAGTDQWRELSPSPTIVTLGIFQSPHDQVLTGPWNATAFEEPLCDGNHSPLSLYILSDILAVRSSMFETLAVVMRNERLDSNRESAVALALLKDTLIRLDLGKTLLRNTELTTVFSGRLQELYNLRALNISIGHI